MNKYDKDSLAQDPQDEVQRFVSVIPVSAHVDLHLSEANHGSSLFLFLDSGLQGILFILFY